MAEDPRGRNKTDKNRPPQGQRKRRNEEMPPARREPPEPPIQKDRERDEPGPGREDEDIEDR
jgi:hypothetical protein